MNLYEYMTKAGIPDLPDWMRKIELLFEPKHHQISGLSQACTYDRFGLFDDQGCGKTIIAQAFSLFYYSMGNKTVCIMPPSLLHQFRNEFSDVLIGIDDYIKIELYNGNPKQRQDQRDQWLEDGFPDILIMSYNRFRDQLYTRRQRSDRENPKPPILECMYLKDNGYSVLIADEATAIKHPTSNTSKCVSKFLGREGESAVLLMTGTPAENTITDLYGYITILTPRAYGSFRNFEVMHVVYDPYSDFNKVEGYKNLEYLSQKLYAQARRVEKIDVLDLPPKLYSEIQVDLDPKHLALYKKLARERLLELEDRMIDAEMEVSLRQKLMQIAMNPHEFSDTKIRNAPVEAISDLLEGIGLSKHKVIIFCHFQMTVRNLESTFAKYHPLTLYGGTKGNRNDIIDKFKNDPKHRIFIVNYLSGGVGLNLQKECSHIIFAEPVGVPGRFAQACDRIHRIGQKLTTNFYLITPLKTSSVETRNQMLKKHEQNQQVTLDRTILFDAKINGVDPIGNIKEFKDTQLFDEAGLQTEIEQWGDMF